VLATLYGLRHIPVSTRPAASSLAPAPEILGAPSGTTTQRGSCETIAPAGGRPVAQIFVLPRGPVLITDRGTSPTTLSVRRFGEDFITLGAPLEARHGDELSIPTDRDNTPWQLQVQSTSPVMLCGLAP
jgi:hypothetical protein